MIAYNAGLETRNYSAVNAFTQERIFDNPFLMIPKSQLLLNSQIIDINDSYKYRPDKVAYEIYGDDLLYPWILQANGLGSIANFIPSQLNYEVVVPNKDFIDSIKL